jgi:integrase
VEATVAILARIPKQGERYQYRLVTLEKNRRSGFIKPENALCYYLRYTDAATKKRVTVPAGEDYDAAVVKALNIGNNQSAIRNGQEAPQITTKAERLTVRDAVGQWLATFPERLERYNGNDDNGLSPASIAAYTKTAEDFLEFCERLGVNWLPKTDRTGEQTPEEVNADLLTRYQSELRKNLKVKHTQFGEAKDRQGTINSRFRCLSVFFSFYNLLICESPKARDGRGILRRNDMPRTNKAKKLREAKAKLTQSVIIYSDEEIKAMLAAATKDESDLIKFLLETGVRDKEAAHVEWDDIDGDYLHLKDKPKYEWKLKDKEKRSVPLNPKLIARLKARRARLEARAKEDGRDIQNLIFPNSLNRPNLALDETIQRVVAKARKSGFEWNPRSEVTMHKFRKNFATAVYRKTKDILLVRDLLGHADIATTLIYIAVDTKPDAEAMGAVFDAFGD